MSSSVVTAKMVADLREITGIGMMDCKKALIEAEGDIKKAESILRIKTGSKASKVAGRLASEGVIAIDISADCKHASILEVNCETDFVAKNLDFLEFARLINQVANHAHTSSIDDLMSRDYPVEDQYLKKLVSIEEARKNLIGKLGENISIRRVEHIEAKGFLCSYLHNNKIGTIVDLSIENDTLGKDIAMHIVASRPLCVSKDNLPEERVKEERAIYEKQVEGLDKPKDIIDKMILGKLNKFFSEVTLLSQNFVKDPDITVGELLKKHNNAMVYNFKMLTVGEGIEKTEVNFAKEVEEITSKINQK